MFELLLGVVIGGALSLAEKKCDNISIGINSKKMNEIKDECYDYCQTEEFSKRISGNAKNDWYK